MIAGLEKYRPLRIGFIGAGQLAVPVAWSLARAGFQVVGAASRSRASAEQAVERHRGCTGVRRCAGLGRRKRPRRHRGAGRCHRAGRAICDLEAEPLRRPLQRRHRGVGAGGSGGAGRVDRRLPSAADLHQRRSRDADPAGLRGGDRGGRPVPARPALEHGHGARLSSVPAAGGRAAALSCLGQLRRLVPGAAHERRARPVGGIRRGSRSRRSGRCCRSPREPWRRWRPTVPSRAWPVPSRGPTSARWSAISRRCANMRPALLPTYLDLARRSMAISEAKGGASKEKLDALRALLDRSDRPASHILGIEFLREPSTDRKSLRLHGLVERNQDIPRQLPLRQSPIRSRHRSERRDRQVQLLDLHQDKGLGRDRQARCVPPAGRRGRPLGLPIRQQQHAPPLLLQALRRAPRSVADISMFSGEIFIRSTSPHSMTWT